MEKQKNAQPTLLPKKADLGNARERFQVHRSQPGSYGSWHQAPKPARIARQPEPETRNWISIESMESMDSMESLESMESMDSLGSVVSMESMESIDYMEAMESMEDMNSMETL